MAENIINVQTQNVTEEEGCEKKSTPRRRRKVKIQDLRSMSCQGKCWLSDSRNETNYCNTREDADYTHTSIIHGVTKNKTKI